MASDTDLRSNFEHGSVADVTRRAQWKGAGLSDEDLEKPKIAVVNSSSELARRREAAGEPELPESSGWLSIYQRAVQPMSTGAVLVETEGDGPSNAEPGGADDD